MKCPTCKDVNLTISDRQGIEIDYCPECRGVWLDRGELDKIIDRSAMPSPHRQHIAQESGRSDHGSHDQYNKGRKRKGFLRELLDF